MLTWWHLNGDDGATGGTAPYTGTEHFTQSAEQHAYTVTDANGCTQSTISHGY
jgi:hypothetical protein